MMLEKALQTCQKGIEDHKDDPSLTGYPCFPDICEKIALVEGLINGYTIPLLSN